MQENGKIIPDKIIRSKRKTVSLSVDVTGQLIVRAPLQCSEARILAFIEKKANWILKQKSKFSVVSKYLPTEDLDGFQFPLMGSLCTIEKTSQKRVRYDETECVLYIPQDGNQETVRRWLKKKAKEVFFERTDRLAKVMDVRYQSVGVSSAQKRWGSCSHDNKIRYTFHLLFAPIAVIDYVIIHELSHTIHKNHGKLFWNKVAKYCPDWKIKRKWLKDNGYLMRIF